MDDCYLERPDAGRIIAQGVRAIDTCKQSPLKENEVWYLLPTEFVDELYKLKGEIERNANLTHAENVSRELPRIANKTFLHDYKTAVSPAKNSLLSDELSEGEDFQLVDASTWSQLVHTLRFNYDIAIPRGVYTVSQNDRKALKVDIQPLRLWLYRQPSSPNVPPADPKMLVLSRSETYRALLKKAGEAFNVASDDDLNIYWSFHPDGATSSRAPSTMPTEWTHFEITDLDEQMDPNYFDENVVVLVDKAPCGTLSASRGADEDVGTYDGLQMLEFHSPTLPATESVFNKIQVSVADALRSGGLVGLQNLGNTCFMNSALQCLSHILPLTEYFLDCRFEKDLNKDNPLGMGGRLAVEYGNFLVEAWSASATRASHGRYGNSPVVPRRLKQCVGRFAPSFVGYQQQDSQEFLAFLLDGLHEDLNLVKKKPYVEAIEADESKDSKTIAEESWRGHTLRNNSKIVSLFQGQYRSRLQCPVCDRISIVFDPFMYLSVPLPKRNISSFLITVVMAPFGMAPVKVGFRIQNAVTRDLVKERLLQQLRNLKRSLISATTEAAKKGREHSEDNKRKLNMLAVLQNLAVFQDQHLQLENIRASNLLLVQYNPSSYSSPLRVVDSRTPVVRDQAKSNSKPESLFALLMPSANVKYMEGDGNFTKLSPTAAAAARVAKKRRADNMTISAFGGAESATELSPSAPRERVSNESAAEVEMAEPLAADPRLPPHTRRIVERSAQMYFNASTDCINMIVCTGAMNDYPSFTPTPTNYPIPWNVPIDATCAQLHGEIEALIRQTSLQRSEISSQLPFIADYMREARTTAVALAAAAAMEKPSSGTASPSSPTSGAMSPSSSSSSSPCSIASPTSAALAELHDDLPAPSTFGDGSLEFTLSLIVPESCMAKDFRHTTMTSGRTIRVKKDDSKLIDLMESVYANKVTKRFCYIYIQFTSRPKNLAPVMEDDSVAVVAPGLSCKESAVTLDACLQEFLKAEQLGSENTWYCNKCKDHVQAYKKIDLWRLPQILVIHLKRFQQTSRWHRSKNDSLVIFPHRKDELLDLQPYVLPESLDAFEGFSTSYRLISVSEHVGGLGAGHYTAKALCSIDGCEKWVDFEDSCYRQIKEEEICRGGSGYLLFYQRVDSPNFHSPSQ